MYSINYMYMYSNPIISYIFSRNPIFLTMGPEEVIFVPMDKSLEFSIPQVTPWVEVISGIMTTFVKKKMADVFLDL